jgi:hypothetical protein
MNKQISAKSVLKVLVNLAAIGLGAFFIMNIASDIQLSAGAILLVVGFNGLLNA